MPNEYDQFLSGLEDDQQQGVDILEQPLVPGVPPAPGETPAQQVTPPQADDDDDDGGDVLEFKPRNRRERRLLRKLTDEKNSSSFLAGKLEAMTTAQQSLSNEEADYLKGLDSIFGTDTPETRAATDLLKKAFIGSREDAKRAAIAEYRAEQQQEAEKSQRAQAELDGFIDEIEDTYGVQLNATQEKSFVDLLRKMSPKDANKNIVGYADPHAVWEVFVERSKKTATPNVVPRAKNLANRSMTQGATPVPSTLQDDSAVRFLRESGII